MSQKIIMAKPKNSEKLNKHKQNPQKVSAQKQQLCILHQEQQLQVKDALPQNTLEDTVLQISAAQADEYLEYLRKKITQHSKDPFSLPFLNLKFQQLNSSWKSSTEQLDLQSKMYGLRVDNCHDNTMKMLSHVIRNHDYMIQEKQKGEKRKGKQNQFNDDLHDDQAFLNSRNGFLNHSSQKHDLSTVNLQKAEKITLKTYDFERSCSQMLNRSLWAMIFKKCESIQEMQMNTLEFNISSSAFENNSNQLGLKLWESKDLNCQGVRIQQQNPEKMNTSTSKNPHHQQSESELHKLNKEYQLYFQSRLVPLMFSDNKQTNAFFTKASRQFSIQSQIQSFRIKTWEQLKANEQIKNRDKSINRSFDQNGALQNFRNSNTQHHVINHHLQNQQNQYLMHMFDEEDRNLMEYFQELEGRSPYWDREHDNFFGNHDTLMLKQYGNVGEEDNHSLLNDNRCNRRLNNDVDDEMYLGDQQEDNSGQGEYAAFEEEDNHHFSSSLYEPQNDMMFGGNSFQKQRNGKNKKAVVQQNKPNCRLYRTSHQQHLHIQSQGSDTISTQSNLAAQRKKTNKKRRCINNPMIKFSTNLQNTYKCLNKPPSKSSKSQQAYRSFNLVPKSYVFLYEQRNPFKKYLQKNPYLYEGICHLNYMSKMRNVKKSLINPNPNKTKRGIPMMTETMNMTMKLSQNNIYTEQYVDQIQDNNQFMMNQLPAFNFDDNNGSPIILQPKYRSVPIKNIKNTIKKTIKDRAFQLYSLGITGCQDETSTMAAAAEIKKSQSLWLKQSAAEFSQSFKKEQENSTITDHNPNPSISSNTGQIRFQQLKSLMPQCDPLDIFLSILHIAYEEQIELQPVQVKKTEHTQQKESMEIEMVDQHKLKKDAKHTSTSSNSNNFQNQTHQQKCLFDNNNIIDIVIKYNPHSNSIL